MRKGHGKARMESDLGLSMLDSYGKGAAHGAKGEGCLVLPVLLS